MAERDSTNRDFSSIVNEWIRHWEKQHHQKFSNKTFTGTIGMTPSYLSRLRSGLVKSPGPDTIETVATGFGVSPGDFLNGPYHPNHHIQAKPGEIFLEGTSSAFFSIPFALTSARLDKPELSGGDVYLPHFTFNPSHGGGMPVIEEKLDHLPFKSDWVVSFLRTEPENLALVDVVGDAMKPTLFHGDIVLVDRSKTKLVENGLYVFRSDTGIDARRIERQLGDTVLIKNDNPSFTDFIYDPAESTVFGRVLWRCGLLR